MTLSRRRKAALGGVVFVLAAGLAAALTIRWRAAEGVWGDPSVPASYQVTYSNPPPGSPPFWTLNVQRSAVSGTTFTASADLTWHTTTDDLHYIALQYAADSNGDAKIDKTEWRTAGRGTITRGSGVITAQIPSTVLSTIHDGWAIFIDDSLHGPHRREAILKPGFTNADWP